MLGVGYQTSIWERGLVTPLRYPTMGYCCLNLFSHCASVFNSPSAQEQQRTQHLSRPTRRRKAEACRRVRTDECVQTRCSRRGHACLPAAKAHLMISSAYASASRLRIWQADLASHLLYTYRLTRVMQLTNLKHGMPLTKLKTTLKLTKLKHDLQLPN